MAVNASCSGWSNANELFSALVFDLFVMFDDTHVVRVFIFAHDADQQDGSVVDRTRILAVNYTNKAVKFTQKSVN